MFDWEENVFIGLKSLWRRLVVAPTRKRDQSRLARLSDRRHELFLLAHLVAGRPVRLFETEDPLLWRDDCLFLPSILSVAESAADNADLYRIRTIIGALALRENWTGAIPDLVRSFEHEFPALPRKVASIQQGLPDGLTLSDFLGTPAGSGNDSPDAGEQPEAITAHQNLQPENGQSEEIVEIEGKNRTEIDIVESREDFGVGSEMPEHVFEKVETLEEYTGQSRKSEAEEDLEDHREALDDLQMTQVMRSTERPRSIYRADLLLDSAGFDAIAETAANGIPYPEWDYRNRRYRKNWCHVREDVSLEADTSWIREVSRKRKGLIEKLRRQFATVSSEWLRVHRQPFGGEFDIDAVIAREVDRRIGQPETELIYQDRKRDIQDCAALMLFDQSFSTESWLEEGRVLDTIRETIFCCGEILWEFIESFGIAGFNSHTRHDCRFIWLKQFPESWEKSKARLGVVNADGYTRIGPALRHSQEVLINVPARRKIVILVTDGRPCDYDRYEGGYGIHDVKKAIETGKQEGIQTHAYAIEKHAAEYFPRMFTKDHYDIVPNPEMLAQHLCRLFLRLKE